MKNPHEDVKNVISSSVLTDPGAGYLQLIKALPTLLSELITGLVRSVH
jgi:hypothetical protein